MRNNNFDGLTFFGILAGLLGLGYGVYQNYKMSEAAKKIDLTLEDVTIKTPVEIQQSLVDKAVDRAVERAVLVKANEAANNLVRDIHNEIEKKVRKEVTESYKDIQQEVADKISDQVAAIDEYALKESVTKQAEQKILKKFDGCLDGVLGDYRRQLQNVTKVWESVSDAITPKRNNNEGKMMTFRLD